MVVQTCSCNKNILNQNDLSGKTIKPFATNAGWLGKTFKEIRTLCPNSEICEGMNIVFESYSDKLVTKEQDIENWINKTFERQITISRAGNSVKNYLPIVI